MCCWCWVSSTQTVKKIRENQWQGDTVHVGRMIINGWRNCKRLRQVDIDTREGGKKQKWTENYHISDYFFKDSHNAPYTSRSWFYLAKPCMCVRVCVCVWCGERGGCRNPGPCKDRLRSCGERGPQGRHVTPVRQVINHHGNQLTHKHTHTYVHASI